MRLIPLVLLLVSPLAASAQAPDETPSLTWVLERASVLDAQADYVPAAELYEVYAEACLGTATALLERGAPCRETGRALMRAFELRRALGHFDAARLDASRFAAAGLDKPDISVLSDEFLAEVRGLEHRNLAVELLRKLLGDEVKERSKHNVVQGRSFAEMLEKSIRRYQNRAIEAAQVIEELIALAKEMREAAARGEQLGLSHDEVAFYDALEMNGSAVEVLGDETLKEIARQLVEIVKRNVSIDWTVKESVRAKLRVIVKRVLRKHGYPPDKQEEATKIVLQQAELLSAGWTEAL